MRTLTHTHSHAPITKIHLSAHNRAEKHKHQIAKRTPEPIAEPKTRHRKRQKTPFYLCVCVCLSDVGVCWCACVCMFVRCLCGLCPAVPSPNSSGLLYMARALIPKHPSREHFTYQALDLMMTICFLCVCVYVCLVGKCACLVVVAYVVHYARGAGPPMSSDTTHADHPTTQLNLQLNHAPTYPRPIMRAKPSVVCLCVCACACVVCEHHCHSSILRACVRVFSRFYSMP